MDRVVGLAGVRAEIAVVQTPDGRGRLELTKFHTPSDQGGNRHAPANTPGIRHVAFAVEDIDAVVAGLRARGAELVGELERYEDSYRLRYVRGPEGIIVELAEQNRLTDPVRRRPPTNQSDLTRDPQADRLLGRLEELQAVAEWVIDVDASEAGEVGIPGGSSARGVEASDEHVKVVDEHARMCLASRPERLFDAKVQFDAMTAKPRAAPACEDRRLVDLSHAEHAGVERPRSVLVASGHRQLHVMQAVQHTGKPDASRPTTSLRESGSVTFTFPAGVAGGSYGLGGAPMRRPFFITSRAR